MRIRIVALVLACSCSFAGAFDWPSIGSFLGNMYGILLRGLTAANMPDISPNRILGSGQGKVEGNVNIFSGQPVYSIPLGSLGARDAVGYSFGLSYSGPSRPLWEADNDRGPVGWIGMGWEFSTPFIAVNHKGTYTSKDDVIMCSLGPFGGGQIIQHAGKFFLSTNPFITITADMGAGEFAGQPIRWTITMLDGMKLVFGDNSNAQRTVFYNGNSIKASPNTAIPSTKFIYRWDISWIANFTGANKVLFSYKQETETGAGNRAYVRESHIQNIKWLGGSNAEVQRYEFQTADKAAVEYSGYAANEPRDEQKLFEKKYLSRLISYQEGTITHYYQFDRTALQADGMGVASKALLGGIKVFAVDYQGVEVQENGWTFGYDTPANALSLLSIKTPSGRTDSYTYAALDATGSDAEQDNSNYTMLRANGTPVPLPADEAKKGTWKIESSCDERFCYAVAKDRDDLDALSEGFKEKMYVDIRLNTGNHFDHGASLGAKRFEMGAANTPADSLEFIPAGDYFLAVDRRNGIIQMWEWDGYQWLQRTPFNGDPRYNATTGFGHNIMVRVAGDYFLVFKTSTAIAPTTSKPAELIPVLRTGGGGSWTSLNQDPAACQFSNKLNYGMQIRASTTSGACMEYNRNTVLVNASERFFTAVYRNKTTFYSVSQVYKLTPDAANFTDISRDIPTIQNDLQFAVDRACWNGDLEHTVVGPDYFLFVTVLSGSNARGLAGFYFDGTNIYNGIAGKYPVTNPPFQIWGSQNYFVTRRSSVFELWSKNSPGGNVLFQKSAADLDVDLSVNWSDLTKAVPVVRAYPSALTVEFYPKYDSLGARPLKNLAGTQYAVNLFQINRNITNGWANRTSQLLYGSPQRRLFNISLSYSDDTMIGLDGYTGANATCGATDACTYQYRYARATPKSLTSLVDWSAAGKSGAFAYPAESVKWQTQEAMATAGRLVLKAAASKSAGVVNLRVFQNNLDGYGKPANPRIVTASKSSSGLGSTDKDNLETRFTYRDAGWAMEMNCHTKNPQFESVESRQYSSKGLSPFGSRTVFYLDTRSHPYFGKDLNLNGLVKMNAAFSKTSPDTTVREDIAMKPVRSTAWPEYLYLSLPVSRQIRQGAANQSQMSSYFGYHHYSSKNGMPLFTSAISGAGPHRITQTILDSKGIPEKVVTFASTALPDDAKLTSANPTAYLNTQADFTALVPITASKSTTNSNYLPQKQEIWRDVDAGLTDAQMRSGNTPVFNLAEGWIPAGEALTWNAFNQPTQTKIVRSNQTGDESHSAIFYEGARSQPVAMIANSRLENTAVLMAENGNTGYPKLDDPNGKWETNSSISYSGAYAHTGRYGLKVVDNAGPAIKLILKNVVQGKFGYRVSVWICPAAGTTPSLQVERRRADNTIAETISGALVAGSSEPNKWGRWQVILTHAQLTSGGLFTTSAADYLRIYAGTGAPSGNTAKIAYVDDFLCLPSNARFVLTTYDFRGLETSSTNGDHIVTLFERGGRGEVMGVRDERSRIFGQGAAHLMGEN